MLIRIGMICRLMIMSFPGKKIVRALALIALLPLAIRTARAGEAGEPAQSGLVGKAGPVETLEFEPGQPVCNVRLVLISGESKTPNGSSFTADDDGGLLRIGINKRASLRGRQAFRATVARSHSTETMAVPFAFHGDGRSGKEYFAPRVLSLSDSTWTKVYGYLKEHPLKGLQLELLACKNGKRGGAKD